MTADETSARAPLLDPSPAPSLVRAAAAEFVATAFLLIAVVGSGIMGQRLSGGLVGLALLANAIATGGALVALILAFEPQSGAHMNPVVTLAAAWTARMEWRAVPAYLVAQFIGAVVGVWLAHIMFGLPIWQFGEHARAGLGQWTAEAIATFGLLAVIEGCRARRDPVAAFGVAAYIAGAYWFTASTSFANPAATVARALTDSFAGIRPADVPGFILAQLVGLALARALTRPAPIARTSGPEASADPPGLSAPRGAEDHLSAVEPAPPSLADRPTNGPTAWRAVPSAPPRAAARPARR